ncbi:MAG: adenylate/guanylate cyclase domain-containing protein [Hyphomicrobiales bacterium]|nr:adenylate/guanylate cyclase domain-containing protein [Hyphomicrobiales bacterium]
MSVVSDSIETNVQLVLNTSWDTRNGQVVPATEDVKLAGGAVNVTATYLYADLAGSSLAAHKLKKEVTGKLIRSYLDAASRVIKHYGGAIRSFDGDRVMGIFMGDSKNSSAMKAGLGINWAVSEVLDKKFAAKWSDLNDHWNLGHGVGIATGEAMLVRGGVRASNDLIAIGRAPNVAAKLSDLRGSPNVYCTEETHDHSHDSARIASDGRSMWSQYSNQTIGGTVYRIKGSTWWKRP